ncbi:LOW QUALITY PROTEIN: hypothetical protein PHMEG_0008911 [Phytophthora megakarya]|uniref:Eukaryotic/viral aspartic protease n=1 Tax=Phytophthora megakarya TaxID=4795 RepID=A0A225WJ81_9STRA|nr:LOW QUALITY PROTEIN: hypothetical protein PHMEG_0008911 [Phytophthora megakarya]
MDTAFARKVGCYIDSSQIQDWVGSGDNVYRTEGKTRIKETVAGSLVNCFDIWGISLAILGMDFMVPDGIRLDHAHGSISLPDEVRIQLSGRRQRYNDKPSIVNLGQYLRIQSGESVELPLCLRTSDHEKFWVTLGDHWVPTIVNGSGKIRYMRITIVGDKVLILHQDLRFWLAGDHFPRQPGFISVGSRRGIIWSGSDRRSPIGWYGSGRPAMERPEYETPREILQRPRPMAIKCLTVRSSGDQVVIDLSFWDSTIVPLPPLHNNSSAPQRANDERDQRNILDTP